MSILTNQNIRKYPAGPDQWEVFVKALDASHGTEFNVKDYGATGDGTTGDKAAIDACIAAAVASGAAEFSKRTVYFPGGRYNIEEGLATITASDITLMGDGVNSSVLLHNPTGDGDVGIDFDLNQERAFIRHLTIRNQGSDGYDVVGIRLSDVSSTIVHDVWVDDYYLQGTTDSVCLEIQGRELVSVSECYFQGHIGVRLRSNPNYATIDVDSFNFHNVYIASGPSGNTDTLPSAAILIDGDVSMRKMSVTGESAFVKHRYGLYHKTSGALAVAQKGHISLNAVHTEQAAEVYPDLTGTHDGGANQATLTDSGAAFPTGAKGDLVGSIIQNTTDGSEGRITANTATTVTATLEGGTDNDWDDTDAYHIVQGWSVYIDARGGGNTFDLRTFSAYDFACDQFSNGFFLNGVETITMTNMYVPQTTGYNILDINVVDDVGETFSLQNAWTVSTGTPQYNIGGALQAYFQVTDNNNTVPRAGYWIRDHMINMVTGGGATYDLEKWDSGRTFYTQSANATETFNLPAAVQGMKFRFVSLSNFDVVIVCDGSETIKRGSTQDVRISGATNGTLTLTQSAAETRDGNMVTLECILDGEWAITAMTGYGVLS